MMNRFKGLDLVDRVPEELWTEVSNIVQEVVTKPFPRKENALVIANTLFQEHKRRLYTWTSPDGQYLSQINYIFCNQR